MRDTLVFLIERGGAGLFSVFSIFGSKYHFILTPLLYMKIISDFPKFFKTVLIRLNLHCLGANSDFFRHFLQPPDFTMTPPFPSI